MTDKEYRVDQTEKGYCELLDSIILQHMNDCVDHKHLSLTLDAISLGGRILGLQIWKFYEKLIMEGDRDAVGKCLDIMPHLDLESRKKYYE